MSDVWKRMQSWELVLPPSRPSLPQLEFFRGALNRVDREAMVAVLGSTPEYRDLLAFMGFQKIFVFERNQEFYENSKKYRSRHSVETLILGDWLNSISKYPNTFDAILSDLTSGNVPYKFHEQFYGSISSALTKDGIFCDKILTHGTKFLSFRDIYVKYQLAPLNLLSANHLSCEGLFCSELLRDEQILDTSLAYHRLEALSSEPGWLSLVNYTKLITPEDGRWYYGKPWQELSKIYNRHIQIVLEKDDFPGSPYEGKVKLFVGRKLS